jgi:hypothetical protein
MSVSAGSKNGISRVVTAGDPPRAGWAALASVIRGLYFLQFKID